MNFNDPSQWVNHINKKLLDLLNQNTPKHEFKNVIEYSLLPAGKLFRPLLVLNAAKDLNRITEDHLTFAAAIEMHHTYTLIHDDLPAMDDDDERRGRPSCHIKFTEHDAILAGDALLAISFGALSELSSHCQILLKKMYEYTGAQGLILGQVKDLAKENDSIENILEIHELKTARLIQLSLVGSAIICNKQDLINDLEDLGKYIGINFQLLDDLCELTEIQTGHELDINPFLKFDSKKLFQIILENNEKSKALFNKLQADNLHLFYKSYYNKMKDVINSGKGLIIKQTNISDLELSKL